jgi:GT2 family glycosyltransferase
MKSSKSVTGLTSIIVPCWNQLEFTQQCLAAVKEHTRPCWELIVIDNGSTDGTGLYLAGARDLSAVPVTVVSNTTNLGFPAAINQGLQLARGEYLVLLNNDVVVTDAWLDQLIALANSKSGRVEDVSAENVETKTEEGREWRPAVDSGAGSGDPRTALPVPTNGDPRATASSLPTADCLLPAPKSAIGLVGPMSNYAAPPQLVEGVPYRHVLDVHAFARRWRDEHRGQWFTVPKLSGFCLLMKRAVYTQIGGLDERFGLGFFDDDDLAERARRVGFELAVAHDLFVHHFGSRTFVGNGIDAGKLLGENAKRFADKWGLPGIDGRPVALRPWNGNGGSHADAVGTQAWLPNGKSSPGERASAPPVSTSIAASLLCVRPAPSNTEADAPIHGERAKTSLTMIVRD